MIHRKPHALKPNESVKLPQRFIAFDCETQPHDEDLKIIHRLWFGYAKFFTTYRNPRKKNVTDETLFKTPCEFWDFIESKLTTKDRIILTAHNIAFDLIIANGIHELKDRGFELSYPIFNGARFIASARRKGQTLLLLDTMNYAPTSLKHLGDSLGFEKLAMPDVAAPFNEWLRYCRRDVEIVEMFWLNLIDFIHVNQLCSFGKTAASLAMNTYRHSFMDEQILIHTNKHSLALERDAYYGGRCECFFIGKPSAHRLTMLDVNSLYPSVMVDNLFPSRLLNHFSILSLDRLYGYMKSNFVIAEVGVDTQAPAYPMRQDGKLIFPVGQFVTVLTQPELIRAKGRGEIKFCNRASVFSARPLFGNFVKTFYAFRQQFKQEGNGAFDLITKIILNSLYGKFGQRGHNRTKITNVWGVDFGSELVISREDKHSRRITIFDGIAYYEKEEGESYNSFPAIAAATTGYARNKLYSLIEQADSPNVFYCDTDSLLVNDKGLENLESEIDAAQLGKLKIVWQSADVEIRGAKDYTVNEKDVIKGIRSNAERIDEMTYAQLHFSTFLESIRNNRLDSIEQKTIDKHLSRIYDKGLVGADGFVKPLSMSVF